MNLLSFLRHTFLTVAAIWLGLAGAIAPGLFEVGAEVAAWDVIILGAIALAAIVVLTKPAVEARKS